MVGGRVCSNPRIVIRDPPISISAPGASTKIVSRYNSQFVSNEAFMRRPTLRMTTCLLVPQTRALGQPKQVDVDPHPYQPFNNQPLPAMKVLIIHKIPEPSEDARMRGCDAIIPRRPNSNTTCNMQRIIFILQVCTSSSRQSSADAEPNRQMQNAANEFAGFVVLSDPRPENARFPGTCGRAREERHPLQTSKKAHIYRPQQE
jgi:hypothetical protein